MLGVNATVPVQMCTMGGYARVYAVQAQRPVQETWPAL